MTQFRGEDAEAEQERDELELQQPDIPEEVPAS